ncbi:Uma2 family endonuclease [Sphaerothrix gracilis]|uniref:Uma2 family endonuclease n=1 Tax=Sphaerothrix gracilis TaxID=3151835 RepID=UPI0031FC6BA3
MTSMTNPICWTVSDLEGFPDTGNRYEIIAGELLVTRAPHLGHQDVIGLMYAALLQWSLQSAAGKPYISPGIIFAETDAVIPDLIWISHERLAQLMDQAGHLTGAPELVVEVLSKTEKDKKRDRETKLKLYSTEGVLEYWIVDRDQAAIEVYRRQEGFLKKAMTLYAADTLTSPLLPEFNYSLKSLFAGCS